MNENQRTQFTDRQKICFVVIIMFLIIWTWVHPEIFDVPLPIWGLLY